jgi:rhamnose utilization protein RhaD (predicted bifunctional aldolase and dehydrogenase)
MTEAASLLETVTALSHAFGTPAYVKGGGGNSSAKNADTVWVKPSGTTLGTLAPGAFVALDRARLARLYDVAPPADPTAREALVKTMMLEAVRPGSAGRPSVEAPLHNAFDAAFVVHTHPPLVNGMTCAVDGRAACARLFPEDLWIDYTDPGYTLSMEVRRQVRAYAADRGRQPDAVFLQNHGVFVAGDTADAIRAAYARVTDALRTAYAATGVATELAVGPNPDTATAEATARRLQDVLGPAAAHVAAGGAFPVPDGPLTPDHIVYARSYPLAGDPTPEAVEAYRRARGMDPWVIVCADGVYGLGAGAVRAGLALELAQDGALVTQLAAAFGGVRYLSDRERDFIENWEVEAYRRKQI